MTKKGGKKKSKRKSGGGGAAKVPDVKNIISPGHKEEDHILYGESESAGNTTDSSIAAPATTGSREAPAAAPVAASEASNAPALQQPVSAEKDIGTGPSASSAQPAAAEKKKESDLPVSEETYPTKDAFVTASSEPSQQSQPSTSAISPSDTMTPAKENGKKTKAEAKNTPVNEMRTTHETSNPRPVSAAKDNGKDDTALKADTALTAAGAAGAAAYVAHEKGQRKDGSLIATSAQAEKVDETPSNVADSTAVKNLSNEAGNSQAVPVATAPIVAPHVKRPHQNAIFTTQERDQPPKKPRVDDHDISASELAIPGRYPTPSVSGSTASATDSVAAGPGLDVVENTVAKPGVANETTPSAEVADKPAIQKGYDSKALSSAVGVPGNSPSSDKLKPAEIAGIGGGVAAASLGSHEVNKNHDSKTSSTGGSQSTQQNGIASNVSSTQASAPIVTPAADIDSSKGVAAPSGTSAVTPGLNSSTTKDSGITDRPSALPPPNQDKEVVNPTGASNSEDSSRPVGGTENIQEVNGKDDKGPSQTSTLPEQKSGEYSSQAPESAANAETKSKSSGKSSKSNAKKGGFFAWLKRKFKGEKAETPATGTNGH